jgi:hypothetical protein
MSGLSREGGVPVQSTLPEGRRGRACQRSPWRSLERLIMRYTISGEQALHSQLLDARSSLTPAQTRAVEHALGLGPKAHGFDTDQWEAQAGRPGHRAVHRRAVRAPCWGLEAAQAAGVELAGAGPACRRARRAADFPLGRRGLAADCGNAQTRRAWPCGMWSSVKARELANLGAKTDGPAVRAGAGCAASSESLSCCWAS